MRNDECGMRSRHSAIRIPHSRDMATLRDIRRRITSVKSTQQITRAMKLVAAAKLRRAQERLMQARPYSRKMGEVLADLALRSPRELHPLLVQRASSEDGASRKLL